MSVRKKDRFALGASRLGASNYADLVMADGPIISAPFQELSGTVAADVSGNGNHGTISAGVTVGQPGPNGGTAFGFLASAWNPVYFTTTALNAAMTAQTQEIMFKTIRAPSGGPQNIMIGKTDLNLSQAMYTSVGAAGALVGTVVSATGAYNNIGTPTTGFNDGLWHHCANTFDGSLIKIYVDGVLVGTSSSVTLTINATGTQPTIGAPASGAFGSDYNFEGSLAHAAFYTYALSAGQVAVHALSSGFGVA